MSAVSIPLDDIRAPVFGALTAGGMAGDRAGSSGAALLGALARPGLRGKRRLEFRRHRAETGGEVSQAPLRQIEDLPDG